MPVAVFVVGCIMQMETFSVGTFSNMLIVSVGVAIASYGALASLSQPLVIHSPCCCLASKLSLPSLAPPPL